MNSRVLPALVAVSAICVSCGRQAPAPAQAASSGQAASSAPAAVATASESARRVIDWLPGESNQSGWRCAKAPQVFGPDDLWEFIDGAAEIYVGFGFAELVSRACVEPSIGGEATIDVYRMSKPLEAFGIYAQERSPAAKFIDVGAEGYVAANVCNFWNGPYYVKITATKSDEPLVASMVGLARNISARIGAPQGPPPMLIALPARGQVPYSARFVPRDVLGQSYLVNAFEAQYGVGAKPFRLVVSSLESQDAAADSLARYQAFVECSGQAKTRRLASGDGGFAGSTPFDGPVVAVRSGATLGIVLGAPSERAALDLIADFLARSSSLREKP